MTSRRPTPARKPATPERPAPQSGAVDVWLAGLAALVPLVVHRRVLGAYFVPDDFVQLARAHGFEPWPASVWRWLSGWAVARVTTAWFGTDPWPYHALHLALLALAAALLYRLARRWGASPLAAFAGAAVFGASRVHFTALVATSWTGEFLSLALVLGALLAFGPGARRTAGAALLLVAALAAKESVLALPLALLLVPAAAPRGTPARRAALALAAAGIVAGAVFIADGRLSGRIAGGAYETDFGANLAWSLFTLLRWAADPVTPVPDLATNPDPGAWPAGLAVLAALLAAGIALRRRAPVASAGVAWCLLGLLPVLPLANQTYLHYLVTPWAGIGLAIAGALDAWVLPALAGPGRAPRPAFAGRAIWAVLALVLAWSLTQDRLLAARRTAVLPGGDTPVDPVLRKSEYARRLVEETRAALGGRRARVAYFILEGTQFHVDLRTGEKRPLTPEELAAMPNVVAGTLGDGTPLRILAPNVDSVLFVRRLEGSLEGFECFLPDENLHLQHLGRPPEALELLGAGLVQAGLPGPAARMLGTAAREWPGRPRLLWVDAVALAQLGERDAARARLREIVRVAPADSFAARAREALASEPAPGR